MAVRIAFLGTRALADLGLAGNEAGLVLLGRPGQGAADGAVVMAVDHLGRPAGGLEAHHLIAGLGDGRHPVDGGVVVVKQHAQAVQFEAAGQRDGLVADAFHQAAVAGDDPCAVVHQIVAITRVQMTLGHGHAHRGGDALAQGAGGRLDARRVAVFRVARRGRAPLAEILDLLHRHGLEAGQMQQGIDQHRAVARRQHEAVAVRPVGRGGVVFEELGPQHGGHVGHAHGHALVAGLGLVHGIHGKNADGVGHHDRRGGHGIESRARRLRPVADHAKAARSSRRNASRAASAHGMLSGRGVAGL